MVRLSAISRIAALGLFAAVCGAGGAVVAVTSIPQVREVLRGPMGSDGQIGQSGSEGTPGKDAASVDPTEIKRAVISDLSTSSCFELGTEVRVVTDVTVSPFDTFGRPTLDLRQQSVCVLR